MQYLFESKVAKLEGLDKRFPQVDEKPQPLNAYEIASKGSVHSRWPTEKEIEEAVTFSTLAEFSDYYTSVLTLDNIDEYRQQVVNDLVKYIIEKHLKMSCLGVHLSNRINKRLAKKYEGEYQDRHRIYVSYLFWKVPKEII